MKITDPNFTTIILAAGLGKRMGSPIPKVLHYLAGKPLIHYTVDLAEAVNSTHILVVVGYKREMVMESLSGRKVSFVIQEKPLGTADAVKSCRPFIEDFEGDLFILSGDIPLLRANTVNDAYQLHRSTSVSATVFTFEPPDPSGYGRIIRRENQELEAIIEEKDADEKILKISEVNAGIYFFKALELLSVLPYITAANRSGEYYLTDAISLLRKKGLVVQGFKVPDPYEVSGINTPQQLAELEGYLLQRESQNEGNYITIKSSNMHLI
ncbi:MAG: sugar phosphate nucleotidyltransferase [bacterium]